MCLQHISSENGHTATSLAWTCEEAGAREALQCLFSRRNTNMSAM